METLIILFFIACIWYAGYVMVRGYKHGKKLRAKYDRWVNSDGSKR